jgi:hypothetical protein
MWRCHTDESTTMNPDTILGSIVTSLLPHLSLRQHIRSKVLLTREIQAKALIVPAGRVHVFAVLSGTFGSF